jgi:hypothetical protein
VQVVAVTSGEGRLHFTRTDGSQGFEPMRPGQMYIFRPIDTHEIYSVGPTRSGWRSSGSPFVSWQRFITLAALDRSAFMLPETRSYAWKREPSKLCSVNSGVRLCPYMELGDGNSALPCDRVCEVKGTVIILEDRWIPKLVDGFPGFPET